MLSKTNYLKLCAEKPEIFGSIPRLQLDEIKIEELRQIPKLAVGEISGIHDMSCLLYTLSINSPDAFLPTVSYTGTEYGDWEGMRVWLKSLQKTIEKELKIYCASPVFLGAPRFWWVLNGRFANEIRDRFSYINYCYGCRLYSFALRVPLCKKIDAHIFIPSIANDKGAGCKIFLHPQILNYYSMFMTGFGINVLYESNDAKNKNIKHKNKLFCIIDGHYDSKNDSLQLPDYLRKYFESYALPAAASVISKTLTGNSVDYEQVVMEKLFQI